MVFWSLSCSWTSSLRNLPTVQEIKKISVAQLYKKENLDQIFTQNKTTVEINNQFKKVKIKIILFWVFLLLCELKEIEASFFLVEKMMMTMIDARLINNITFSFYEKFKMHGMATSLTKTKSTVNFWAIKADIFKQKIREGEFSFCHSQSQKNDFHEDEKTMAKELCKLHVYVCIFMRRTNR